MRLSSKIRFQIRGSEGVGTLNTPFGSQSSANGVRMGLSGFSGVLGQNGSIYRRFYEEVCCDNDEQE